MRAIKDFLKRFDKPDLINFDNVIKIKDSYFLKPKDNDRSRKAFIKFSKDANEFNLKFIGIPLGSKSKKSFSPSLFFLDLLKDANVPVIKINKKGEWLFVCGRDLQGINIYKCDVDKNDYALVINLKNEVIGYGFLIGKPSGTRISFKHVYDIGDYLRRER